MKKSLSLLLAISFVLISLTACSPRETSEIRLAGLKGPTSMGMVYLLDASDEERGFSLSSSIYGSADEITPKLIRGELDMATIPANLASVLYHKTEGSLVVLAINTLGVLYIVENGVSIKSFDDLRGQVIYATGKGSTPEYTLRHLLSTNGLDPDKDVELVFKSEPAEIVALLKTAPGVAMLPEPYVAVAENQVPNLHIAMDLNKEWEKSSGTLITGVLMARRDFVETNPHLVNAFLKQYEASIKAVKADYVAASALIEKYDIVKAAIAQKALPYCNLTYIAGADLKTSLTAYYQTLLEQNPAAVGGSLPQKDFYYESMD